MDRKFPRAAFALAVCTVGACAPETVPATQLLLQLQTDLSVEDGLQHVLVEVLDATGKDIHDSRWFSVDGTCLGDGGTMVILGSLGLPKARRDRARLRVTGYGTRGEGPYTALVATRLDAGFKANTSLTLPVVLAGSCLGLTCAEDEACTPTSGECEAVAETFALRRSTEHDKEAGSCLTELEREPSVVVGTPQAPDANMADASMDAGGGEDTGVDEPTDADAGGAGPLCESGDGVCSPGCSPVGDADCRGGKGTGCAQASDCKPNLSCVLGVCCDKPCTGACETCSAPGSVGTCSPIDFEKRDDAANCRACGRVCSGTHVEPMCNAGECVGACELGYSDCNSNKQADGCETDLRTVDNCDVCGRACSRANVSSTACTDRRCVPVCLDGFLDCNADSGVNDGCEENIQDDPMHCGGCGPAYRCSYPFCHGKRCARVRGRARAADFERTAGDVVVGALVTLRASVVVGFGALLRNVSQPPAHVRFALYERGNAGTPMALRAESGQTQVVDYVPPASSDALPLYTVAPTTPVSVFAGDYWVLIVADKPIDVFNESNLRDSRWQADAPGFPRFSSVAPLGMLTAESRPILDLSLFVVEAT